MAARVIAVGTLLAAIAAQVRAEGTAAVPTTTAAATATTAAPAADKAVGGSADPGTGTDKPEPIDWLAVEPLLGRAQRVDGDEAVGVVAFTFDDGPSPETTPAVIAALEKYDVPASFFVVARRIVGKLGASSRAILAREDREGFTIGCHSWSHINLKYSTKADAAREVDQAQKVIAEQLGRPIGMFRPPYGSLGGAAAVTIAKRGLTDVLWSIDTLDWRARSPDKLRKKVLRMILAQHGGVVLMHDTKKITASIIGGVLDDLEAENCARLARNEPPIVPVSLHYFLTDGARQRGPGTARPVPPEVAARTAAYQAALPARCAARAPMPPPAAEPIPAPAAPATQPSPAQPSATQHP
jgi:peptidoglycan-N-acetylglucosamine deacetylase